MTNEMRYLAAILLLFAFSCGSETEIHQCSGDISEYTRFQYKFLDKQFVKLIADDSIFKAEVLIERNPKKLINPKDSLIPLDSVLCYCLAICKKESLSESRFYRNRLGFEVAKKYGVKKFKASELISVFKGYDDNHNFSAYSIASFKIDNIDKNWKEQITSDNLSTLYPRQIHPRFKKKIETKLIVK